MSSVIGIQYTVTATDTAGGATASPKEGAKTRGAERKP
jgi:hypothetical protein